MCSEDLWGGRGAVRVLTLYAAASLGRRLAVSRKEWEGGAGGGGEGSIEADRVGIGDGGGGKKDDEREDRVADAKGDAWEGT